MRSVFLFVGLVLIFFSNTFNLKGFSVCMYIKGDYDENKSNFNRKSAI